MEHTKNVLNFWLDMEYFNPQFLEKKELKFDNMPWIEDNKDNYDKEVVCNYGIYLGKIKVNDLVEKMESLSDYLTENITIQKVPGYTSVCGLVLNENGVYIPGSFVINPFFFTISTIIKNKNIHISISDEMLDEFNSEINDFLKENYIDNSNNKTQEMLYCILSKIYKYFLYEEYKDFNPQYYYLCYETMPVQDDNSPAQIDIIKSFFAKDIKNIIEDISNISKDDAVYKYINAFDNINNKKRIDNNIIEMKKWLELDRYPMGKWPSPYSPSLMQQIAINIAISEKDRREKIFSVNGPPGTGKTTLLKEIIAETVVKKAKILYELDPTNNNFNKCFLDNPPDDFNKYYYEIPNEISNLGIVVASNNNSAVENISMELPLKIEKSFTDKFKPDSKNDIYFSDIADKLLGDNQGTAWGLISARLGKSENISKLNKMLFPEYSNSRDRMSQSKIACHYKDFSSNDISMCWKYIKNKFSIAWDNVTSYRNDIKNDKKLIEKLENEYQLENIGEQINNLENNKKEKNKQVENLKSDNEAIKEQINYIKNNLSLIQKLIYFLGFGTERTEVNKLIKKYTDNISKCEKINLQIENIKNKINELTKIKIQVNRIKEKYGDNFANKDFFQNEITENQKSQRSCPWTNEEYDKLREELFYWSLQLQKYFILSSKAIKNNIKILNSFWGNKRFSETDKKRMFPHLFATLSLLIPVVSTTFASVSSFLKYVGKKEMGILIVDESGQATPQSALGALWRSNSAIIVGDPLQVEPICSIPDVLINVLGEKNKIEDKNYYNKSLSAQNLADNVNEFVGEINGRIVGCPLVVHRRCLDPMFTISNIISYDGRMFNETFPPKHKVKKSLWVDIKGKEIGNKNHYVQAQGKYILDFMEKLLQEKEGNKLLQFEQKQLYIISPFTSVVFKIQELILNKYKDNPIIKKQGSNEKKIKKEWIENFVGTVHKFQGKEAKTVLLVLGCDSNSGLGAAKWAGSKANILNVAVTRAKEHIEIIGDKELWKNINYFSTAINILDNQ